MSERIAPKTYRDLLKVLRSLDEKRLGLPVLVTTGMDDYGESPFYPVTEIFVDASAEPRVSAGDYAGPVLLVAEQTRPGREEREAEG